VAEPVQVPPEHVREPRPRSRRTELERLVDLTVLGSTHPELGTCWLFTGTTTPYGRIAKAQDSYTHRLGWKLLRGPIPEGRELHHRCGVYACWNPDHLQLVTHAENLAFKRKTHCKHGHPLSGENVRSTPGQGHEFAGHAFGRTNGGFGRRWAEPKPAIQAPPDKPANPAARLVDLVPSSSALSTARSWDDATHSWEPAGCSPGQLTPMGGLVKAPSGSSTAWAGFSYAARYPTAWSFTIGVASMPAGILTICSWSLTPRIWRTAARRTASVDTRCRVPTYGSTQGLERGSAVSAARSTSERFANA
jgi:HNH endonuclease